MRNCGPSHIRHKIKATGTLATASLDRNITHYSKAFWLAILHSLRTDLKGVVVSAAMTQVHEVVFKTRILNLRQDRRVGTVGKAAMLEGNSCPRLAVHTSTQTCHDLAATNCMRA